MTALDLQCVTLFLLTVKGLQAKCIISRMTWGRCPCRAEVLGRAVGGVARDLALLTSASDVIRGPEAKGGCLRLGVGGGKGAVDNELLLFSLYQLFSVDVLLY